ncbi:transcription/translation regulatory transformer protein RfaH [Pseudoalteromonas maricaloris]|uniref:transcription/translation regulatory transformer protein RfaH n=1 Tax=Pseudoalteromonas maricaloris TaxID=184924 RepID=UPI000580A4D4|nr:transcription/translation regulatory transformer protein RfaH [Pseudoalteromonas flavipulchra]KID36151.1 transcriptional regulator [Pseudoalteromonas flavipulchra NCIMB 2033 = ATCC BAA-314]MBD0780322.1 transcription/translation regulatory transformer protein RfaH [Pseudoalteromonas flavipulchra]MBE0371578.1 transcriptional antiterminator RfaH [Pseudoalteromonas flavipulchra NCIMB 2033 = ATCC BAA-314]
MECWYLLYCKPKQEHRAQSNLQNQGIESCFPTFVKRKTSGSKAVKQPLFPRYLFVKLDPHSSHFSAVKNTRGVSDFIRYGVDLQMVPDELVAQLMNKNEIADELDLQEGDLVQLTDGCYKDIHAIYQQPDGELRSILLIKLLNHYAQIVVDNCTIKKVQ